MLIRVVLPRAVGAEQAEEFALPDVEADVVQRLAFGLRLFLRGGVGFGDGLE
jgi:hypothetical protein